jgi:hypothetical protein
MQKLELKAHISEMVPVKPNKSNKHSTELKVPGPPPRKAGLPLKLLSKPSTSYGDKDSKPRRRLLETLPSRHSKMPETMSTGSPMPLLDSKYQLMMINLKMHLHFGMNSNH